MENIEKLHFNIKIKPANFKAMETVGWFNSDAANVKNWSSQLFNNSINLDSESTINLHKAINSAILEVENDLSKIKEFLNEYSPIIK